MLAYMIGILAKWTYTGGNSSSVFSDLSVGNHGNHTAVRPFKPLHVTLVEHQKLNFQMDRREFSRILYIIYLSIYLCLVGSWNPGRTPKTQGNLWFTEWIGWIMAASILNPSTNRPDRRSPGICWEVTKGVVLLCWRFWGGGDSRILLSWI